MLIIMAGLPGTGKSTVARQLANRLPAIILSKDTVRHVLFPPGLVEYSTAQDDFVIEILLRTAEYIWRKHPQQIVILDGRTFSQAHQRRCVTDFAERARQRWRIIECSTSEEVARQRLALPDPAHPAGNRTPELYDQVKARWEPINELKIGVYTDQYVDFDWLLAELRRS
jgi:predicted kinase